MVEKEGQQEGQKREGYKREGYKREGLLGVLLVDRLEEEEEEQGLKFQHPMKLRIRYIKGKNIPSTFPI